MADYEEMKQKQIARAEDLLQRVKDDDPIANIVIAYAYEGKDSEEYRHYYPLCSEFCDAHLN